MAGTPDFGLGEHLTAITAIGQVRGPTGTFTPDATTYDLYDVFLSIRPRRLRVFEEIAPSWSRQLNEVPIREGFQSAVTVLRHSQSGDDLEKLSFTFDYVQLTWTYGDVEWEGYFAMGEADYAIDGHGQQVVTVDLRPINPGVTQVTRTVAP